MKADDLIKFVEVELNNNNEYNHATAFLDEVFEGQQNIKIRFEKNHREQYNKVLKFCADNDGIIISTQPGTLATVVRVERD